ncbi:MAG: hypothetical protein ABI347_07265 [Nitrososphaera sp.]|jgi:hypothetical protein
MTAVCWTPKNTAIKHLDLMHEAIENNELKKALFHKKMANMAMEEMVGISKMVENLDPK